LTSITGFAEKVYKAFNNGTGAHAALIQSATLFPARIEGLGLSGSR
jgi:hypothetical protein